eukprot:130334_1
MANSRESEMSVSKCSLCNSNNQKLVNKIQDLNLKYEALEHKYETTKLEKIEYKNRMNELQQETEEQRLTIQLNKKRFSEELLPISPMMQLHMSNMESEIIKESEQIDILQDKLTTYRNTISNIQSENNNLRNENENFRQSLILNNKQKQIQQITILTNQKEIYSLNTEIQQLRDELNALQISIATATASKSPSTPGDFLRSPPRLADGDTMRLQFVKSPASVGVGMSGDQSSLQPFQFAALMGFKSATSAIDIYGNNLTYNTFVSIREDDSLDSFDTNNNNEVFMKLKLKLERLEKENKELLRQMEVLGNNDEMKYVEEYDTVRGSIDTNIENTDGEMDINEM